MLCIILSLHFDLRVCWYDEHRFFLTPSEISCFDMSIYASRLRLVNMMPSDSPNWAWLKFIIDKLGICHLWIAIAEEVHVSQIQHEIIFQCVFQMAKELDKFCSCTIAFFMGLADVALCRNSRLLTFVDCFSPTCVGFTGSVPLHQLSATNSVWMCTLLILLCSSSKCPTSSSGFQSNLQSSFIYGETLGESVLENTVVVNCFAFSHKHSLFPSFKDKLAVSK